VTNKLESQIGSISINDNGENAGLTVDYALPGGKTNIFYLNSFKTEFFTSIKIKSGAHWLGFGIYNIL
jgi:hypothetical protein